MFVSWFFFFCAVKISFLPWSYCWCREVYVCCVNFSWVHWEFMFVPWHPWATIILPFGVRVRWNTWGFYSFWSRPLRTLNRLPIPVQDKSTLVRLEEVKRESRSWCTPSCIWWHFQFFSSRNGFLQQRHPVKLGKGKEGEIRKKSKYLTP